MKKIETEVYLKTFRENTVLLIRSDFTNLIESIGVVMIVLERSKTDPPTPTKNNENFHLNELLLSKIV